LMLWSTLPMGIRLAPKKIGGRKGLGRRARRALSVADVPEEELGADTEGALEEEGLEDHVVLQVGLGKGGEGKGRGGREDSEG